MTILHGAISAKRRRWILPGEGAEHPAADARCVEELARELKLPGFVAGLLVQRGIVDCGAARAFLRPEFKTLHEPGLLPNMGAAVERIVLAIEKGERILLFGDYDVDGITGTAMLWHVLRAAMKGAGKEGVDERVKVYIPHRVEEGYGLSVGAMEKVIGEGGAGAELVISIDCGGSAVEPIRRQRGVDVIVTDHHELGTELPEAVAIVHPRMMGSKYPNADLCGAGVAYKLAWALATRLCGGGKVNGVYKDLLIEFAALVGLATIADVVPLVGENRVLVKYGLQQLGRTKLVGLQALMAAAGYAEKKVDCMAVGFGLAPRLNAAGRMDHAQLAVELLTTATAERAKEIAEYLESQNKERQATEKRMLEEARRQVEGWLKVGEELPRVIVVHSVGHHAGVVGIVASRLVEIYHRPTFVLACDDQTGECHGSARSIAGFEIHGVIECCRHLLISGGGHAMAGGVKLRLENLEAFRACVNEYAAGVMREEQLVAAMKLDGVLAMKEATVQTIGCLEQFEPFGRGNAHPRFLLEGVRLTAPPRGVGATGAHLQMQFAQGNCFGRGIAFKAGELAIHNELHVGLELDLVVEPRVDTFNGKTKVDYIIVDMARSDGAALRLGDEA